MLTTYGMISSTFSYKTQMILIGPTLLGLLEFKNNSNTKIIDI